MSIKKVAHLLIIIFILSACGNNEFNKVSISVTTSKTSDIRRESSDDTDIKSITLDIIESNSSKAYIKKENFIFKNNIWQIGKIQALPVHKKLTFITRAYNNQGKEVFNGIKQKDIITDKDKIHIILFPINNNKTRSIPEMTKVIISNNNIVLNIKDNNAPYISYKIIPNDNDNDMSLLEGDILLSNHQGNIKINYTPTNKDGKYEHDLILNNKQGGILQRSFTTKVSTSNIRIAPTIQKITAIRENNKLSFLVDASDEDKSTLKYKWSLNNSNTENLKNISIENYESNPFVINNFNDAISGNIKVVVTDKTNLKTSSTYTIVANQFSINYL